MKDTIDRAALRKRLEAYADRYLEMSKEAQRRADRLEAIFPEEFKTDIAEYRRQVVQFDSAMLTIDRLLMELDEW